MKLDLIRKYFEPKLILDIGANIGQFQMVCHKVFPESKVISFEANLNCEEHLRTVSESLGNLYMMILLAKDDGNYTYYTRRDDALGTGNSIYRELTDFYTDENTIATTRRGITLDEVMTYDGDPIPDIDLIKIDTQGSELDIISGGINTCKNAKGILLEVSVTPYNDGAPLKDDVVEFMSKLGFTPVEVIDEIFPFGSHQQDILFIATDLLQSQEPNV